MVRPPRPAAGNRGFFGANFPAVQGRRKTALAVPITNAPVMVPALGKHGMSGTARPGQPTPLPAQ